MSGVKTQSTYEQGRSQPGTDESDLLGLDRLSIRFVILIIIIGSGLYGGSIGIWRSYLQGLYSAIKFPLLIFATVLCTSAINGAIARIWGSRMNPLESARAVLLSFAIIATILGSLSPTLYFLAYNVPPSWSVNYERSYALVRIVHVGAIAVAGIVGVGRLFGIVLDRAPSRPVARRILIFWLSVNLFVGAQFSWTFRPFIGSPSMETEFLREHPLKGNFYEEVWKSFNNVM